MSPRLIMLPSAKDYVADAIHDPLRFYYYPILGYFYRKRVEMCLDLLPGGNRILEVGFGSGVTFLNLSNRYRELHGLDLTSNCAAVASCFAAHGIRANLVNGTVTDLPYADESFNTVLLISILEHLKPQELTLACQEIYRVLCPGGVLVYGVPVERPLMVAAFKLLGYDIRQHHFSTEKQIEEAAERCFLSEEKNVLRMLAGYGPTIYETQRFRKC